MGIQTNDQKVLKYDFFDNCRYYLKKKVIKKSTETLPTKGRQY